MHEIEKLNAKMASNPDGLSDAHVDWFRMTMNKVKNFPDHLAVPLVERMLAAIAENVAETEFKDNEN